MRIQTTSRDVVFSGHGSIDDNGPYIQIPGGVKLIVLAPPGASITDRLGGMLERGEMINGLVLYNDNGRSNPWEPIVYEPLSMSPNFILHAPLGLVIRPGVPHMIGVGVDTPLSDLWIRVVPFIDPKYAPLVCYWAACAAFDSVNMPNMVDAA